MQPWQRLCPPPTSWGLAWGHGTGHSILPMAKYTRLLENLTHPLLWHGCLSTCALEKTVPVPDAPAVWALEALNWPYSLVPLLSCARQQFFLHVHAQAHAHAKSLRCAYLHIPLPFPHIWQRSYLPMTGHLQTCAPAHSLTDTSWAKLVKLPNHCSAASPSLPSNDPKPYCIFYTKIIWNLMAFLPRLACSD